DWVLFEAPVTGVDYDAFWGAHHHSSSVGNRVVYANKLDAKVVTKVHLFVRFGVHNIVFRCIFGSCLFHVFLYHGKGKLRAIDWCWKLVQQVAYGTNVVEVAVSEYNTAKFVLVGKHV